MAKRFNVTGTCFPEDHYMADVSKKWELTYEMTEEGEYFIINRPRQYGKTTTLYTMAERLTQSGKYLVFNMSFEGIGDDIFKLEATFASGFVRLLTKYAQITAPELVDWLTQTAPTITDLELLDKMISVFVNKTDKKVVVLIDEVDKSSNNQLFISFLAMLRNKYLERKTFKTFHSVVLAGVHDVKSLKFKVRQGDEQKYNSPWNIATEFTVDMNLQPDEIKPMLADYMQEKGIAMDTQLIADRLFYLTSGYPFLVSQMCKIIAEEIMPTKVLKEWTEADVNKAFQLILRKGGITNFDTLIKNLQEYPDLYDLVFAVVVDGVVMNYEKDSPLINLGTLHGIFAASKEGTLMIHNRIYRERIANYMISEWHIANLRRGKIDPSAFDYVSQYHLPNQALDMQKVLTNFQAFMKKEYSSKSYEFLERDGRLIFLAFMKPIINGAGYDFKEPQISEEKRLDVVITYHQHLYVAELKIWRGAEAHKKGLAQLVDYLDIMGLDTGFLLIFDTNKKKKWEKDWTDTQGKRIFWVRV
jgi:AAA-like domain